MGYGACEMVGGNYEEDGRKNRREKGGAREGREGQISVGINSCAETKCMVYVMTLHRFSDNSIPFRISRFNFDHFAS